MLGEAHELARLLGDDPLDVPRGHIIGLTDVHLCHEIRISYSKFPFGAINGLLIYPKKVDFENEVFC